MMFFTNATICFTISTEGSGASVAGIILTSCSVIFDSSSTFFSNTSFLLSINPKSSFACKDSANRAECKINTDLFSFTRCSLSKRRSLKDTNKLDKIIPAYARRSIAGRPPCRSRISGYILRRRRCGNGLSARLWTCVQCSCDGCAGTQGGADSPRVSSCS